MIIKSTEKNTNKATIVVEIESDLMNKGAEIAYKKARIRYARAATFVSPIATATSFEPPIRASSSVSIKFVSA